MRVRKEEEIEKKRAMILTVAKELLIEDGIEQFSMRNLAQRMHMTPGILYHYYKNKEALLMAIVAEGYQKILSVIRHTEVKDKTIDEIIYAIFYAYIQEMWKQKEILLIVLNTSYPLIQEQTAILEQGIAKKRSSIQALCQQIEEGKRQGIYVCEDVELRAQCIWCGVYGLLDRMVKEGVEETQKERLIQEQLKMLIGSLRYVK